MFFTTGTHGNIAAGLLLCFIGLGVLVAGLIAPAYLLHSRVLRMQAKRMRTRFTSCRLFYVLTNGIMWIDQGQVTEASPWSAIQGVREVQVRMRGAVHHTEWSLDFVNGTHRWIDLYQFDLIQRYWPPIHAQQGAGGILPP